MVINGGTVTVDALKTDGNIEGIPRVEVNDDYVSVGNHYSIVEKGAFFIRLQIDQE